MALSSTIWERYDHPLSSFSFVIVVHWISEMILFFSPFFFWGGGGWCWGALFDLEL